MTSSKRLWFAAERGEDQHGDRMFKDVDQAVSNQAALNHDGSGHEVTGATVECQKQLVDDDFESNVAKKGSKVVLIQIRLNKIAIPEMIETKADSVAYKDIGTEKGMEYMRNIPKENRGKVHSRLL